MTTAADLYDALRAISEFSETLITEGEYTIDEFTGMTDEIRAHLEEVVERGFVELSFCGGETKREFAIDDVVDAAVECSTLREGKVVSLTSARSAYQIVQALDRAAEQALKDATAEFRFGSIASVQLLCASIPVAAFACRIGAFNWDWYSPLTGYPCVRVRYDTKQEGRTEALDRQIVDSFLFELASTHAVPFERYGFIREWLTEEDEDENTQTGDPLRELRRYPGVAAHRQDLECYNEGMELFVAACQVTDRRLRFLSFFKVLEYFGPVVLTLDAHNAMRRKLETAEARRPNGQFIQELFAISRAVEQRRNIVDMLKGVLLTCLDFQTFNTRLPAPLRARVDYETATKDLDKAAKSIAEALCSTRNEISHARSNYVANGNEITSELR